MVEILSQTKLLGKEEVEKVREEFVKQNDLIKGDCFSDLLENIDKYNTINKATNSTLF